MATILSIEQILALAPDTGAAKAGQGLASKGKWVTLGRSETAAWGECSGSASTPYQTQIDLNGPSFKCSCPSRKFPCKHGLGLYLLLANQSGVFSQGEPPEWVANWLAGRAKREDKNATAAETAEAKPVDEKAQAKRIAKREENVSRGLEELDRWLCDLVRGGLGAAQAQPHSFWENTAKRMVDAQASGVARLIRQMADIPSSGEGWQERLLERLGKLHLLLERYKRIEALPEPVQADLRALIGFTQSQEELLAGEGVADRWAVLGQRVEREDRLRVQRTWLWGTTTGRSALILQYAAGKEVIQSLLIPGTLLDAEIVFYPGACPLRALVKSQQTPESAPPAISPYATIAEAYKAYAGALTKYPWLEQFPLALAAVYPLQRDGRWIVRDEAGHLLPLSLDFKLQWELLAFSGGHPVSLFGEWDGDHLLPLGVWTKERFVPLTAVED
ncbi:MAG: SWIM zinc finger family protein [Armatimonadota bacterium]